MRTGNHPSRTTLAAVGSVVAAALLWATMGIFVRNLSRFDVRPMSTVALRAWITVAILLAVLAVTRRTAALRVRPGDLWCFLGTGICSIVFFNYCYFLAITLTSLAVAAVLLYTAPAIVMLMSIPLFGERPTARKRVALVLAFTGCLLVAEKTPGLNNAALGLRGLFAGLGAGLGYALHSIFGRYAINRGYRPLTITTYTFLFASVGVLPFVTARTLLRYVVSEPRLAAWSVAMAICTTVLPYLLYTNALRHLESSRASIIASVEPVAATIIGAILYRETLNARIAAGVALVIASIALLSGAARPSPLTTKSGPAGQLPCGP